MGLREPRDAQTGDLWLPSLQAMAFELSQPWDTECPHGGLCL